MNLPISWLHEFVDLDCDINNFIEKITISGTKVESLQKIGSEISNVVIGEILSVHKHPNADKLVVCLLDIGNGENLQIVTGATNIFKGALVPVAKSGATLVGGIKIKEGELRGIESRGMMCSIEELGYTKQEYPEAPEHGIYIFQEKHNLGLDVVPLLQLREDVVEFEVTSNRPDCFSIIGLARETAATFNKPMKYPKINIKEEADGDASLMVSVEIENPELCLRYAARVVKNVKIQTSPLWMRHRLMTAGIRPINNIVDITNYVMLEYGQPLHAFDIDNIDNRKIIVRNANDKENFTTLDGINRTLDPSVLVIADSNKALAIAGIMGGLNSYVTQDASAIFFESACFNGTNIRLSSKKLGLRTDASNKFEKSLDPNLALDAVNRAVQLVELLGCGQVVKGIIDCYPNKREPLFVDYSTDRINKIIGIALSENEIEDYLKRVEIIGKNGVAKVPTFRPDVVIEADIIEEVARFYGYDNIKPTLATGTPTVGKRTFKQKVESTIKDTMVSYGFFEILNYTFESPKIFDKLSIPENSNLRKAIKITNPLGEDFSIMRTTTLNGILTSLALNYNRRNSRATLFELGKVYIPQELPLSNLPKEPDMLTLGMYGKDLDFYTLKGVIEQLLQVLGIKDISFAKDKKLSFMHPGRCANVYISDKTIGFLGEIHPLVAENYGLETKAYVAVINADILYKETTFSKTYKTLPKFPSMERDIAMVVKVEVQAKDIENAIREKSGLILENFELFDIYTGHHIQKGFKSVAYKLTFRADDRTLKEEEVSKIMKQIIANLELKVNAQLREK